MERSSTERRFPEEPSASNGLNVLNQWQEVIGTGGSRLRIQNGAAESIAGADTSTFFPNGVADNLVAATQGNFLYAGFRFTSNVGFPPPNPTVPFVEFASGAAVPNGSRNEARFLCGLPIGGTGYGIYVQIGNNVPAFVQNVDFGTSYIGILGYLNNPVAGAQATAYVAINPTTPTDGTRVSVAAGAQAPTMIGVIQPATGAGGNGFRLLIDGLCVGVNFLDVCFCNALQIKGAGGSQGPPGPPGPTPDVGTTGFNQLAAGMGCRTSFGTVYMQGSVNNLTFPAGIPRELLAGTAVNWRGTCSPDMNAGTLAASVSGRIPGFPFNAPNGDAICSIRAEFSWANGIVAQGEGCPTNGVNGNVNFGTVQYLRAGAQKKRQELFMREINALRAEVRGSTGTVGFAVSSNVLVAALAVIASVNLMALFLAGYSFVRARRMA